MTTTVDATFAQLTTLGVGGPVSLSVLTTSEAELIVAVRTADEEGTPLLVLGGGSNLLVVNAAAPARQEPADRPTLVP